MTSAAYKHKSVNSIEQGLATLGTGASAGGGTTGTRAKTAREINIIDININVVYLRNWSFASACQTASCRNKL